MENPLLKIASNSINARTPQGLRLFSSPPEGFGLRLGNGPTCENFDPHDTRTVIKFPITPTLTFELKSHPDITRFELQGRNIPSRFALTK